jgi:hypothetical protein
MRLRTLAAAALLALTAFAGGARADCPPAYFSGNGAILPSTCGPVVYSGSGNDTLTLPAVAWHGTIVNNGSGVAIIVGSGGIPVNGSNSGVPVAGSSGATVSGDPTGGWWLVAGASGGGSVNWPASGRVVVSNGTNSPAGLAATNNDLVYATGGAFANLASANSAVLVTSAGGVPSLSTTLPSGLTIPGFNATVTWPTSGDIMLSNGGNAPTAYAGSSCAGSQFATGLSASGGVSCATPSGSGNVSTSGSITSGAIAVWNGSTTVTGTFTPTNNDLVYATGGAFANLATANSSVLVTSSGGVPSLSTTLPSGLTIPGYNATVTWPTSGDIMLSNGGNAPTAYGGSSCTGSQFATGLSASGGVSCATPSGSGNVSTSGSITSGAIAVWNGSTTVTGTFAPTNNDLVYATGGAFANLATANSSVLVTSSGGVPSLSSTLPSGLTIPGYNASITWSTNGDIVLANGNTPSAYAGTTCAGGQAVGTLSAAGVATCVSTGGTTTITAGPGLGNSQTTFNGTSTAQTVTNGSTLYTQAGQVAKTANYVLNADCSGGALCDTARLVLANGTGSIQFTAPNPAGTLAPYQMADQSGHGYTVVTVGGTATFIGCVSGTPTSLTVPAGFAVQLLDQGSSPNSYFCTYSYNGSVLPASVTVSGSLTSGDGVKISGSNLVDSGAAAELTHFDLGFIAGVTPTHSTAVHLPVAMTITAIYGWVDTAAGATANVDVYETPSGTACGSGTKMNTTAFNANGTVNTEQSLGVATSSITSGDTLCLVAESGGTWTTGAGTITVWAHP